MQCRLEKGVKGILETIESIFIGHMQLIKKYKWSMDCHCKSWCDPIKEIETQVISSNKKHTFHISV